MRYDEIGYWSEVKLEIFQKYAAVYSKILSARKNPALYQTSGTGQQANMASQCLMGVTVENGDYTSQIDDLRRTGARTKFLSLEPLLSALPDLDLAGSDWAIVGGESGPNGRNMAQDDKREDLVTGLLEPET